jgi:hypothetical protein
MSGDASERCDVGASLNKSFLFLQTLAACVARVGGDVGARCGDEGYGRRSSREVAQRVEERRHFAAV